MSLKSIQLAVINPIDRDAPGGRAGAAGVSAYRGSVSLPLPVLDAVEALPERAALSFEALLRLLVIEALRERGVLP